MSVEAHRIIEFKYDSPSFDLWHNEKFMQFLGEEELSFNLDSYGTGLLEIEVDTLERAVRIANDLYLDVDTVESLQQDIAAAKSDKRAYVTYYCF